MNHLIQRGLRVTRQVDRLQPLLLLAARLYVALIFFRSGMLKIADWSSTLVLFRERVESACGTAESAMGPCYCPPDERIFIDLCFFDDMATQLKAGGDFA